MLSDRIWIVPGIVSFIQDVVSNSDWSSCTKSDEPWWYFLFVHNLLWNRTHSKFNSLSLFKSLTLTFLRVPKIPNFIKEIEKDTNSKKTMSKYCWRGFIWADTLLHYMGQRWARPALFPSVITYWNVFSPIFNCDLTFLSLVCNLEEYFFTSVLGHHRTILPILPHPPLY